MSTREDEFLEAIGSNAGVIAKVCLAYSTSREEFEDTRQEILLNLWNGWSGFRGECKLSTWIYRVALNTCLSGFKKNKVRARNCDSFELSKIYVPVDEAESRNVKQLYELISALRADDRALILLWLDDVSYEDIAQITGLSKSNVGVRLKRIKEKLIEMSNR